MLKTFTKSNYIIFLLSIFSNSWFFFIYKNSLLISLLLVVLNFTLIASIKTANKKWLIMLVALTTIVTLISFSSSFKKDDWQYDSAGLIIMKSRHLELSGSLGYLYNNKFAPLYLQKYLPLFSSYFRNTFEILDLNLFFLASHPRERANVYEYERYWIITLPIFLIGLLVFIKNHNIILLYYLITIILVSGFISDTYMLGPILYFPIINTFLYMGLNTLLNYSKDFSPKK